MKRGSSTGRNGSTLVYTLMVLVLFLNLVILINTVYLREMQAYQSKLNYYQLTILEQRAIRHMKREVDADNVFVNKKETLTYPDGYIHFTYSYNYNKQCYEGYATIKYKHIIENSVITYDHVNNIIYYEDRR